MQMAFTPDRRYAVTTGADGTITLRDSRDFQPTGITFVGNTAANSGDLGPWFTPGGKVMLTASDGRGRLWDFATGTLIGSPFPNDEGWAAGGSANGRWLASVVDGRLVRWDLGMSAWPAIACAAAGRNLTELEWREFGPRDLAYRPTCPEYEIEHATAADSQEAT
jgi:WD40 repeat protein